MAGTEEVINKCRNHLNTFETNYIIVVICENKQPQKHRNYIISVLIPDFPQPVSTSDDCFFSYLYVYNSSSTETIWFRNSRDYLLTLKSILLALLDYLCTSFN